MSHGNLVGRIADRMNIGVDPKRQKFIPQVATYRFIDGSLVVSDSLPHCTAAQLTQPADVQLQSKVDNRPLNQSGAIMGRHNPVGLRVVPGTVETIAVNITDLERRLTDGIKATPSNDITQVLSFERHPPGIAASGIIDQPDVDAMPQP